MLNFNSKLLLTSKQIILLIVGSALFGNIAFYVVKELYNSQKERTEIIASGHSYIDSMISYGIRINNLSVIQDKYECKRDHLPYLHDRCDSRHEDKPEILHFGNNFFVTKRADYSLYVRYTTLLDEELNKLLLISSDEEKKKINEFQAWELKHLNDHMLPVQQLEQWDKLLFNQP